MLSTKKRAGAELDAARAALAWATDELAAAAEPHRLKALTGERERLFGIALVLERVITPLGWRW